MESRFALRMGYQETTPVPDVTIVVSHVPTDAVDRLGAEVERLRGLESNPENDVNLQMYSALTENLRLRKPIMIAPVVEEGTIYPLTVILTFGNREGTGSAESSFGVMAHDGEILVDHLFNGDDHQGSPELRDEYVGKLKEHLKQGHRIKFLPPRLLA